jgi:hypothetical protein
MRRRLFTVRCRHFTELHRLSTTACAAPPLRIQEYNLLHCIASPLTSTACGHCMVRVTGAGRGRAGAGRSQRGGGRAGASRGRGGRAAARTQSKSPRVLFDPMNASANQLPKTRSSVAGGSGLASGDGGGAGGGARGDSEHFMETFQAMLSDVTVQAEVRWHSDDSGSKTRRAVGFNFSASVAPDTEHAVLSFVSLGPGHLGAAMSVNIDPRVSVLEADCTAEWNVAMGRASQTANSIQVVDNLAQKLSWLSANGFPEHLPPCISPQPPRVSAEGFPSCARVFNKGRLNISTTSQARCVVSCSPPSPLLRTTTSFSAIHHHYHCHRHH